MVSEEQIRSWIENGESDTVEFVAELPSENRMAQLFCAFANTKGGVLLVGVRDDRQVVGLKGTNEYIPYAEMQIHIAAGYVSPKIKYKVSLQKFLMQLIIVIEIDEGEEKPYRVDEAMGGGMWRRRGARTERVDPDISHGTTNGNAPANSKDFSIQTKKVAPCFNVDFLAEVFAKHLLSIESQDCQMVGVFGEWGRGKTYFWEKVKEKIRRIEKERRKAPSIIVDFNAWKYQETPAIWAHLLLSVKKELTCFQKKLFAFWTMGHILKGKWFVALLVVLLEAIWILLAWLDCWHTVFAEILRNCGAFPDGHIGRLVFCVIVTLVIDILLLRYMAQNDISVEKQIKGWTFRIAGNRYGKHLGCQADMEEDLARMVKAIGKHGLILYIDDVDRCDDERILDVLESLRTLLENTDIMKKMTVVCAIDRARLDSAIRKKYGNSFDYVRKQVDKIFISGINLPDIRQDEQVEFMGKLIDGFYKGGNRQNQESVQEGASKPESEGKGDSHTADREAGKSAGTTASSVFSKEEELTMFRSVLEEDLSGITPRSLRIMYYRYRLANNLLQKQNIPHRLIALAIYYHTMGKYMDISALPEECRTAIKMVCY